MTDLYPPSPPALADVLADPAWPWPKPIWDLPAWSLAAWRTRRVMRRVPGYEYLLAGGPVQLHNAGSFQVHGQTSRITVHGVKVCYTEPVTAFIHAQFVTWDDLIEVTPIRPASPADGTHEPTVLDYASDTNTSVEELLTIVRQIRDTLHRMEQQQMTTGAVLAGAAPAAAMAPGAAVALSAPRGDSPIGADCQTCQHQIRRWHVDPEPIDPGQGWWAHKPGTCPLVWGVQVTDDARITCPRCGLSFTYGDLVCKTPTNSYIHDEPCVPMAVGGVR